MAAEIMAAGNDAEKNKVKRLAGQIQKLRKDIDKKLGKSQSGAPSSDSSADSAASHKSGG
jgi:hypothetical protein